MQKYWVSTRRNMFVKTDKIQMKSHGLLGVKNDGDKTIFTHAQNVTPDLEFCHEMRKDTNNGWSRDRNYRHIARIPDTLFLSHPEWMQDPSLITKWLRTDEGKQFATVSKGI